MDLRAFSQGLTVESAQSSMQNATKPRHSEGAQWIQPASGESAQCRNNVAGSSKMAAASDKAASSQ